MNSIEHLNRNITISIYYDLFKGTKMENWDICAIELIKLINAEKKALETMLLGALGQSMYIKYIKELAFKFPEWTKHAIKNWVIFQDLNINFTSQFKRIRINFHEICEKEGLMSEDYYQIIMRHLSVNLIITHVVIKEKGKKKSVHDLNRYIKH